MSLRFRWWPRLVCVLLAALACACDSWPSRQAQDLDSLSPEQLTEKAVAEGRVTTLGMSENWQHWQRIWADLKKKHGFKHNDLDMDSGEMLALLQAERDNPTRDLANVGQEYAEQARSDGLTLAYRTPHWESIPAWAKDERGHWIVSYTGVVAFLVNDAMVEKAPESWADVLAGKYKVGIGNAVASSQSQAGVYASAIGMGGIAKDVQPGIEFWKELARLGRIDMGDVHAVNIIHSRVPVVVLWDYNALNYRDQALREDPGALFSVHIPRDGAVRAGNGPVINVAAPHPYAAAVVREYLLSDQGQLELARGYMTPVRQIKIPAALEARRIPQARYDAARIVNFPAGMSKTIATAWREQVLPLIAE